MIEKYKTRRGTQKGKRTGRVLRPATVNRELACLKAMFNHSLKDRHNFENPVSEVEFLAEENEQTRVLSFDEQRKYLAAASPNVRDVATLMLETGMRPEEIYRIRAENIELSRAYLFVPFGKTSAARRRIPLTATARAVLKKRIEGQQGGYVFPHRKDPQRHITTADKGHKAALRDSKVSQFRLYDCRHTWATRAAEAGMDMPTLAALLGHSKLNMVMRYAHPQEEHQADAVRRLEVFNAAKEIAEVEAQKRATGEMVPTVPTTVAETESVLQETTPTLN
jgi:integrase